MKRLLKVLVPGVIIIAALLAVRVMMANKAPPPKVEARRLVQNVEVVTVNRKDVKLQLHSQGMIEAERMTVIASEVSGRVVKVAQEFDAGGDFEEGDVLVEIDAADYEAAATQAEAALADARLALASEQAKAEQAVRDWGKLAAGEKPTELAVRKPHLESATARVKAAEAALVKARRDLERTKIKAPYRGRLRATHTELGSVLGPSARVAEIYSTGEYEVRLPLSLDDFAFTKPVKHGDKVAVRLVTAFGGQSLEWTAHAVRVEGEVERTSRTVNLIARVADDGRTGASILKPGLFVRAQIEGQTLKNVFRVPRRVFLDEQRVLVVDEADRLRFRTVKVVRADGADLLVSDGLKEGEKICITTLAAPVDGADVRIVEPAQQATTLGKAL